MNETSFLRLKHDRLFQELKIICDNEFEKFIEGLPNEYELYADKVNRRKKELRILKQSNGEK